MNESNDQCMKAEQSERLKRALLAHPRRSQIPSPEFVAFLNTQDALGINIVIYLVGKLKVDISVLPELVPLINRHCFEDRLNFEINDILKKIEENMAG